MNGSSTRGLAEGTPKLEEVFKLSGIPTVTFVRPAEYDRLIIALRTPGRGVIVEGPSGIGKTTAVTRAIRELSAGAGAQAFELLSGRKREDAESIRAYLEGTRRGTVVIDDFHRLDEPTKVKFADALKVLADEERNDLKMVIIGVARTGESLVNTAPDIGARIEIIRFEANPNNRVNELIEKGERALNITLNIRDKIVEEAAGSFYLAQMLCHETCLMNHVTEAASVSTRIEVSYLSVQEAVYQKLCSRFMNTAKEFATGPALRREGRAPYLHILKWLAESKEWSLSLDQAVQLHKDQRGSVGQVVDKGLLDRFLATHPKFGELFHYDTARHVISIEDPQFVYFIRCIPWNEFADKVGYFDINFPGSYDFALSFAGEDRWIARKLFEHLQEFEFNVFLDENEQSRILASNLEEYLGPIYRTEAAFVICLMGPQYPLRVWTQFESEQFRARFKQGSVVPVWIAPAKASVLDPMNKTGYYSIETKADIDSELAKLVDVLREKMAIHKIAKGVPEGAT